jgi:radical SAM superfamily enzyme YgiQ (UPF0313 family)
MRGEIMRTEETYPGPSISTPVTTARGKSKRLLLVNPRNPLANLTNKTNYWNKYRVWKPLGLLVLAGVTPPEWEITVIDENVSSADYSQIPLPDLVGLTAFTSQAPRAYELSAMFRAQGVPVVMGGIHATMRHEEAAGQVDGVVTGEAEGVWAQVLDDAAHGALKPLYVGGQETMEKTPPARHDLLPTGYHFGSIQTTRGCPLNCSFCSVSAFNGRTYRRRSDEDVVAELRLIKEKYVLVVDDNLIGTRKDHIARAKDLFRAMITADLGKKWICQATINMADDEELLRLARKAGCIGVFIGFETTTDEGLAEIHKRYHIQKSRDFKASVRRIQSHKICVAGSFIMGLDVDRPGIGLQIADTANRYGVDVFNVLFLTPLPGTELWSQMEDEGRITADRFPEDWQYYTLTIPVGRYQHLSRAQIIDEMNSCIRSFYSIKGILRRVARALWHRQQPLLALIGNLSFRKNNQLGRNRYDEFKGACDRLLPAHRLPSVCENLHVLAPDLRGHE